MYCLDVKAIVFVGMIAIWFFMSLASLVERRIYDKTRWVHHMSLALLIFWCLFALILGGLAERMYAGITLIGMTAMEVLVRRRRRLEQPREQQ